MATKRNQVLDAVVAALGAVGKPAALDIFRYRVKGLEDDDLPVAVVYPVRDESERLAMGSSTLHRLKVRVEARAGADAADSADEALDDYLDWIVDAMAADTSLGGLAMDVVEESTEWDAELAQTVMAAAAVDFLITYAN